MSTTEQNIMAGKHAVGLAAERIPQRTENPSLGTVSRRLMGDVKALTYAIGRQLGAALARKRDTSLQPATLKVDGHVLHFPSILEFEFAIASRVEAPTARIINLEKRTLFELRRMATDIRKQETRFSDVLAASLEPGGSLGALMGSLELKQFSTDYDWRNIFGALAAEPSARLDPYRRMALAKYMQYLRERQRVIQDIYATRGTEGEGRKQAEEQASQPHSALQETSIFDFTQIQVGGVTADDLWVLPRGESVVITLTGTREIDMVLARYPFKLVPGDRTYLVDPSGVDYMLSPGRNTVGRSQECDIVVDAKCREVSRKHLVIDRIDAHTVVLTDLSSHATRVPASRVVGARTAEPEGGERSMVG
ncbi:MAG: FHA domain-containing protein [Chromatiales bacterium]|jgi:hypothetical protein|nr:FHA domain-containing protein [Chromatiales bacterium]